MADTPTPERTAPERTAPEDTAPGDTAPEDTEPEESAPYDQDPPRRKRHGFFARHLLGSILGAIAIVILAVLGGGWLWYSSAASGSPGQGVVVNVALGEGFSQVRASLERQGVITSSLAFDIYLEIHGTPDVEAGQYYLHRHDSFADVANVLNSVPNIVSLQVPPGFTVAEIAARLEAAGLNDLGSQFDTVATSGQVSSPFQPAGSKNLDGLLAAGTYQVLPSDTATSLLREMIARFDTTAQALGVKPGETVNGLNTYQLVTVASIVEKEGVIQKNLAKVSRVIYNRLAAGMPLQMDSTVLYSLGQDGGTVTPADLAIKSPYNTYLNTGLTPTPICFPSTNSLDAAIRPATGTWLYFTLVSQDGTEAFSTTYAGQLANEKLARERGLP